MANSSFSGGEGTEENPYLVGNAEELNSVREDLEAHYKQIDHIDLKDFPEWEPIGDSYSDYFAGSYDGDGYTISNLKIRADSGSQGAGLFGLVFDATFKDIHLRDVDVDGLNYVGALVGYAIDSSEISTTSAVGGIVKGEISVGGLIGATSSGFVLKESITRLKVIAGGGEGSFGAGGLVGKGQGELVENCYSESDVEAPYTAGGIVGESTGNVKNSYSSGVISGSSNVGGLVGSGSGLTIENSFALNPEIIRLPTDDDELDQETFGDIIGKINGGFAGKEIEEMLINNYSIKTMELNEKE